jgi:high mobility group protein B2
MGKSKAEKDPNKPKRPTSAYFYFIAGERLEYKKRGEHVSQVAQWTKEVSVKWRALTDSQKKPFEAQAATDRERYQSQMAIYKPTGAHGKRGAAAKDPNKPKRAQSAYFLFLADFREKNRSKFQHDGGHKDLIRAAGEGWNKLTDGEKAPYQKKHEEEKAKYEVAMAAYAAGGATAAKKAKMAPAAEAPTYDDDDEEDDDEEEEESD